MTISSSINTSTSNFYAAETLNNDVKLAPIVPASNASPSNDGTTSALALPNPRGTVHPAIQQYWDATGKQKAVPHLPQELKMNITRFADPALLRKLRLVDKGFNATATEALKKLELKTKITRFADPALLKKLRLVGKDFNRIATEAVKKLEVDSSADLKEAVRIYSPGGIEGVTLNGRDFTKADLESLPRDLTRLVLNGCSQLTDADLAAIPQTLQFLDLTECRLLTDNALTHLMNMPLEELRVDNCHLITVRAVTDLIQNIDSLETIRHIWHA